MTKLRVLDLFSGIGGFSLGLERTGGFETVAFCEIEPFPRKVLTKHWPEVPCYEDVRTLTAERLAADGIAIDVICGGFPCQDISFAGKGAGLAGERSGLFFEIARLVGELAPRFVILENVAALLGRGLGDVLGTLASLGYDAEWHCIPASYLGAHHRRDRIWIVAYPQCNATEQQYQSAMLGRRPHQAEQVGVGGCTLAHSERGSGETFDQGIILAEPRCQRAASGLGDGHIYRDPIWRTEPDVGRVANGVPDRAHRLKALGNAIVPQIAELIGRAILAALPNRAHPPREGAVASLSLLGSAQPFPDPSHASLSQER